MLMISNYFQALGEVRSSAFLALSRTYLFAIPLTFLLPLVFGESGIWLATPIADLLLIVVTGVVLKTRTNILDWGLFKPA